VFVPPSTTILDIGCAKAGTGAPEGDRSQGIEIRSLHAVTPETETTTHYFWAYARNFRIEDAGVTDMLRKGAAATFDEDIAILEAQQSNMQRFPQGPTVWLPTDSGGVAVRRVLSELAKREAVSNPASAAAAT
jgi:vanillate O-demethylase monooxygenase subunit